MPVQSWIPWRVFDQSLIYEGVGQPQLACVKNLQLGLDPQLADPFGHGTDHVWSTHVELMTLAEVQRSAVDAAHVGLEGLHMGQALQAVHQIGAAGLEVEGVGVTEQQVAAHPRGEVDDHVRVGGPHQLDRLAVQLHITRALARGRISNMDVNDRRTRLGCLQGRRRNLLGGDRQLRMLAGRVTGARDGTSDDWVAIHRLDPTRDQPGGARRLRSAPEASDGHGLDALGQPATMPARVEHHSACELLRRKLVAQPGDVPGVSVRRCAARLHLERGHPETELGDQVDLMLPALGTQMVQLHRTARRLGFSPELGSHVGVDDAAPGVRVASWPRRSPRRPARPRGRRR